MASGTEKRSSRQDASRQESPASRALIGKGLGKAGLGESVHTRKMGAESPSRDEEMAPLEEDWPGGLKETLGDVGVDHSLGNPRR